MNDKKMSKSITGLTSAEVQERIRQGLVNGEHAGTTKSYGRILRENSLTLFNLINVLLLICILISGSLKNALFFLVVIWNFIIGVFQEVRAKKTIEKLSLLSAPKAFVLRDGVLQEIPVKDLVLGDVQRIRAGQQICADGVVLDGSCQVNESLLTGESTPVYKKCGDHLLSGSFLISGQVLAQTEHVGLDNYVNKITLGAKTVKKSQSVIMHSVRSIVRILALCMIPLAGLFVWNNFFRMEQPFADAMVKSVAAISSMIPGGLVLLVSVVLAVSVIRLSAHQTLVQDLYCVENLARVDTLLLDKTGTITEGNLQLEEIQVLPSGVPEASEEEIYADIQTFIQQIPDENATACAIREYVQTHAELFSGGQTVDRFYDGEITAIPFSSERKWSMVREAGRGSLVLGAPEWILPEMDDDLKARGQAFMNQAKRVVLFAISRDHSSRLDPEHPTLPEQLIPAALLVIGDHIRDTAPATFRYFEQEGVHIKVISGDSPETVSLVSQEAGVKQAEQWADASALSDDSMLEAALKEKTVFGRVTPDQKKRIVQILKKQGHVVAMTGDGANDVLALREADCSIAMQNGSDAARCAADLVLLDSDFSSLPLVVAEGRKSINNLQRSAALYLTKTIYAVLIAILFIFLTRIAYPFENIQVTLIGGVTIGIPSFFLALEPNHSRIRRSFLRNVFLRAVPSGVLEAIGLLVLLFWLHGKGSFTSVQLSTASVYLMLLMGLIVIFNIAGKMNIWKITLMAGLLAISAGAVLLFPALFSLGEITWGIWKIVLITAVGFGLIHTILMRGILPRVEKK